MDIESDIRRFVTEQLGTGGLPALKDDDPLIELGVLDSLKIFRLLAHLESAFGLTLDPASLSVESFNSIGSIARLVRDAKKG